MMKFSFNALPLLLIASLLKLPLDNVFFLFYRENRLLFSEAITIVQNIFLSYMSEVFVPARHSMIFTKQTF